VIEVLPLKAGQWLDWECVLKPALEHEASEFLAQLNAMKLPPTGFKRLYLPVLATTVKQTMLAAKRRESEEREGRKTLLQAMLLFAKRGKWKGTAGELIVALGPSHGEWPSIAAHFGRQLRKIRTELGKYKVGISFKRRGDRRFIHVETAEKP